MNYFRKLISPNPIFLQKGLGIVRIIVGSLIVYHGLEVFDTEIMNRYLTWEVFSGPNAVPLVYFGKSAELLGGILLLAGLFTRIGAALIMGTLFYVTFFVGGGKFWYEDQHPFLFVLFGLLFIFTGPGAWSFDGMIFKTSDK